MKVKLINEGGYFKTPEQMRNKMTKDASTSSVQKLANLAIDQERNIIPEVMKDLLDYASENRVQLSNYDIIIAENYDAILASLMFGNDVNSFISIDRVARKSTDSNPDWYCIDTAWTYNYIINPVSKTISIDMCIPGGRFFRGTREFVDIFNDDTTFKHEPQFCFGAWNGEYKWIEEHLKHLLSLTPEKMGKTLKENIETITYYYKKSIEDNITMPTSKKEELIRNVDILLSYDFLPSKIKLDNKKANTWLAIKFESPWTTIPSFYKDFVENIFLVDNFDKVNIITKN